MPSAREYPTKAAELSALAKLEGDPLLRAQKENLARAYLRLAEQADKNATTDLVYETPRVQPRVQQQQQQQQQPDKKEDGDA